MSTEQENIINELKEISPFLLSIRKAEGFAVPEPYFDDRAIDLVDHITDDAILPDYLKEKVSEGFTTPKNYFEEVSDLIQDKYEDEQQLPTFLKSKREEGYQVPVNYFEDLPDDVLAKIELDIALSEEEKQEGFGVPAGYFGKLSDNIIEKVKAEKLDSEEVVVPIKANSKKIKPLWRRYNLIGSIAAVGLLLLIGLQFLNTQTVDNPIDLSNDQALAYLMEEDLDLEQDILNDFSESEINDIFEESFETEEMNINLDDINLEDLDLEDLDF